MLPLLNVLACSKVLNIPVTPTTIMFFQQRRLFVASSLLSSTFLSRAHSPITASMYPTCESRPKNVKNVGHADPSGRDPFPCKCRVVITWEIFFRASPVPFSGNWHTCQFASRRVSLFFPSRFTYRLHFLLHRNNSGGLCSRTLRFTSICKVIECLSVSLKSSLPTFLTSRYWGWAGNIDTQAVLPNNNYVSCHRS